LRRKEREDRKGAQENFSCGRPTTAEENEQGTRRISLAVLDLLLVIRLVALKRAAEDSVIPLLEGRIMLEGKATAYVCQNFACLMPVTEAEALKRQMTA